MGFFRKKKLYTVIERCAEHGIETVRKFATYWEAKKAYTLITKKLSEHRNGLYNYLRFQGFLFMGGSIIENYGVVT